MTAGVPPRTSWAVQLVDPRPEDVVLEIGCGPGVAAVLLCDRLTTGRVIAVDRSPVAVQRTARRGAGHVAAGRLTVVQSSLAGLVLPAPSVDRALAVDVNLFWTRDPGPELAVLADVLRPGGHLFLLYAHGPTRADRVTDPVAAALRRDGFTDVEVVGSAAGTGVRARGAAGHPRPGQA